jgi:hypothetical protein
MATEFNISDAMQVPLKTTGLPSLISEINMGSPCSRPLLVTNTTIL